jgi:DNA-binding transcriptional MerR regulator
VTRPLPWDVTGWGEVAAVLGVSVATVRRWERRHGLPVSRLPTGGVVALRARLVRWARRVLR